MQDTQLYKQLLGLSDPWTVDRVDLDVTGQEVSVFVTGGPEAKWHCPACECECKVYDFREERRWRHLDSCGFTTWLIARVPRVECNKHGVKTVSIPWAGPKSRFTLAFECFAITLLQATKVQSRTAQLLRLSPGQVHDIMCRAVERGLARRDRGTVVRHLSLDEKSFQRGHNYVTVLSDLTGRRVLDVAPDRTWISTVKLLDYALTYDQKALVEAVSMDMWGPFDSARAAVLPQADTVHDRFHIMRYLSEAVDKTRRMEHKRLSLQGDIRMAGSKYLWLRDLTNMTPRQWLAFQNVRKASSETAKVWTFKEEFAYFFELKSVEEGKVYIEEWYEMAVNLGNRHLTKAANTILRHKEGILTYLKHRISNGTAEGLNALIQEIKTVARGYRRFQNFRVAILFFLGKLDLAPHVSP